jgi:exodeoxyribonuclease-3
MKLATWNVNSIRVRKERVLAWLAEARPDVLCMQELKIVEEEFPLIDFRALGYHVVLVGQKTYNGVGIASLEPPTDVIRSLDDGVDDPQARIIGATIGKIRIYSSYIPNGQAVGSEKMVYKLEWLGRLKRYLDAHHDATQPVVVAGDFNVAPENADVHDPAVWANQVLFSVEERIALARLRTFGLVDVYRRHHPEPGRYSWWDYRQLSFPKNHGLRIDFVFATPPLAETSVAAEIDREARKGENPSDHAPVVVTFA